MPTYDYDCEACGDTYDLLVPYAEREEQVCPVCAGPVTRQFPSRMVLKASFPDGHKRKGWDKVREASKLNIEKAGTRVSDRKEISREIKKLGVTFGDK